MRKSPKKVASGLLALINTTTPSRCSGISTIFVLKSALSPPLITTGTPPVITEPNRHLPPAKPSGGLNAKQLDSIRDSTALVNVWDGAVSSGKTIASMMRWLIFLSQTADLPGELVCEARLLAAGDDSQQYAFRIGHDGQAIAEGRAAVMLRD